MQIVLIILYVFICYLVGLSGKNRKFGFYGYFFLSIFITPLLGIILVLASDSKKIENKSA
jgi:uncharacterized membrane protein YiaA